MIPTWILVVLGAMNVLWGWLALCAPARGRLGWIRWLGLVLVAVQVVWLIEVGVDWGWDWAWWGLRLDAANTAWNGLILPLALLLEGARRGGALVARHERGSGAAG